ncbi:carbohydrate sulfotransferase 11-like [Sphaerodactylus townsendi]|uniref:carbohydrate sulfotransferase 11-like n=1 Tax=Sphaerodactylus townsendi TaxID=933632 RepID=UPI0020270FAF|nr:carbohydrate sulfotransferase 11-like [Sphaerodactylus townsendi]
MADDLMVEKDLPVTFDTLLHIQQLRKKTLRSFCGQNAKITALPRNDQEASQVVSSIIVNNKLQLLYCKIPATGMEGLEQLLEMLEEKEDVTLQLPVSSHQQFGTQKMLSQYNLTSMEALLQSYTKVIFIREPFHRLISAYMHGMADGLSFKEFIQYILYRGSRNASPEWKPLVSLCRPCLIHYDYIIMFGFLGREVPHMMQRAGLLGNSQLPEFIDSKIFWTYGWLQEQMFSELSLAQKKQLCQFFRFDFAAFHFPNSLLWDHTCIAGST